MQQFFKYTLSEKTVEIAGVDVDRDKFEEWLTDWHEVNTSDLAKYWNEEQLGYDILDQPIHRSPEEDLLEYIRVFHTKDTWSRILTGIRMITSFS